MNFFSFQPSPWKIFAVVAVLVASGGVYAAWRHSIYKEGYQACKSEQIKAIQEGEKRYEKTSIDVRFLADATLRREFCKWVRDADMPTCLKNLPAFR